MKREDKTCGCLSARPYLGYLERELISGVRHGPGRRGINHQCSCNEGYIKKHYLLCEHFDANVLLQLFRQNGACELVKLTEVQPKL